MRAVAAAAVLLTGCFYLDPIITRPGAYMTLAILDADGQPVTDGRAPRAGHIVATGNFDDAKRHGSFAWHAYACGVPDQGPDAGVMVCDDTEVNPLVRDPLDIRVPTLTDHGLPVVQVLVKLEARDDRGALATAENPVTVIDGPPTLDLETSALSYTVGAPIDVFAKYGDPEFALEHVDLATSITWSVSPETPLADIVVPPPAIPDPMYSTAGKRLIPQVAGTFVVTATATDPAHNLTQAAPRMFQVKPDQPPCLAQWQPIVPPPGQTLPVGEPTVFQVPLVADDLDAFPRLSDDPAFRTATFAWSILPPGEIERRPLVGAGNRITFDPAAFTPGDVVELRVEVFDRNRTPVTCPDSEPTCSITTDASCLQRQTWRVEVR